MMGKSKIAASSRFTTTGFCGKIDIVDVNDNEAVVCSLEDPVGYAALEISIDEPEQVIAEDDSIATGGDSKKAQDGKEFIEHSINAGNYLFIQGELQMELLENNLYLVTRLNAADIKIVSEGVFDGYVRKLLDMDGSDFIGVQPEYMWYETVHVDPLLDLVHS